MYSDTIQNDVINNLENKVTTIANTFVALTSQGYRVDNTKRSKLNWSSILIDAFENIHVFDKEQQDKIESIYNKIFVI